MHYEDHLTIIIVDNDDHSQLRSCIASITKYYPKIKIVVASAAEFPLYSIQSDQVRLVKFKPTISIDGSGLNRALAEVTTKYFMVMPVDAIFTDYTSLEVMIGNADKHNVGVLSMTIVNDKGDSYNDCSRWVIRRGELFFTNADVKPDIYQTWSCNKVYVGLTALFKSMTPWAEDLHYLSHLDMVFQMRYHCINVFHTNLCSVQAPMCELVAKDKRNEDLAKLEKKWILEKIHIGENREEHYDGYQCTK